MTYDLIEDLLPLVERPSRYLGTEINTVRKDPGRVRLTFALAFPDLYEIGTSHFGMQILYHILNGRPDVWAERVFAPAPDMAALLKTSRLPLQSLESGRPLAAFDIVGFSLLYELNYTNMLAMLELGGIPFFADRRDRGAPLVIAGGPAMANPEPVAPFLDAILIGDGEDAVLQLADIHLKWKEDGRGDRRDLLKRWSAVEGVYVPSFFKAQYDAAGFQSLSPESADYAVIRRAVVTDLDGAAFPQAPILPFGRPVHDRLRLEISRGCSRGCRFCQAGMTYRPVRERSAHRLVALTESALMATGYEDLSLLSLSTGDYSCIETLIAALMDGCEQSRTAVSLPSIRAGTLTSELMKLIQRVRKTGFTIAPEAGSQRLRDVINKNISRSEILQTVQDAFALGWQVIKLYFMVGLPTETDADLRELVQLVKELRRIKPGPGANQRRGKINVSVATFIPKPHTPFQWAPQLSLAESRERIRFLQEQLRLPGIQFKWQNPEVSYIEGLFSRGDRRIAQLLATAYRLGCRFDGWSDLFRFQAWQQAIAETGLDADFYTTRARESGEPLPWDHIDIRVTRQHLQNEWRKALAAEPSPDCRTGACSACGVCDFEKVAPVFSKTCPPRPLGSAANPPDGLATERPLALTYAKEGPARFFSHLELVHIFLRAFRRARLPLKYSQGFHPMPKVSFEDPLPIGIESPQEELYLTLVSAVDSAGLPAMINPHLPTGLSVSACRPAPARGRRSGARAVIYRLTLKDGQLDPAALDRFAAEEAVCIQRINAKGKIARIDLKQAVAKVRLISPAEIELHLLPADGRILRPLEVVAEIFALPPDTIRRARCVKQGTRL